MLVCIHFSLARPTTIHPPALKHNKTQRGPDGAITGVNRRLPSLQRLALEYGKGLVELVIAKKREIARFSPANGPQQPSAVRFFSPSS